MKTNKKLLFCSLLVFLNTALVVAQATDGPEPPPPAPINQYVLIVAIITIFMVFVFFGKSEKLQKNNDINL